MKMTWGKAFVQGTTELIVSIGGVLFSPPLSKEFIDLTAVPCEEALNKVLKETLKENA